MNAIGCLVCQCLLQLSYNKHLHSNLTLRTYCAIDGVSIQTLYSSIENNRLQINQLLFCRYPYRHTTGKTYSDVNTALRYYQRLGAVQEVAARNSYDLRYNGNVSTKN